MLSQELENYTINKFFISIFYPQHPKTSETFKSRALAWIHVRRRSILCRWVSFWQYDLCSNARVASKDTITVFKTIVQEIWRIDERCQVFIYGCVLKIPCSRSSHALILVQPRRIDLHSKLQPRYWIKCSKKKQVSISTWSYSKTKSEMKSSCSVFSCGRYTTIANS